MNTVLGPEALELGMVAHRALEAAGGDELAQRAEADPTQRAALVLPVLEALGVWDLEVRRSLEELEAAAAVCRSAGAWALPYPVAERLARPPGEGVEGLVLVSSRSPRATLEGLSGRWRAVDLDGRAHDVTPVQSQGSARATGFIVPLEILGEVPSVPEREVALGMVLSCWTLLGLLDRALDLSCTYVQERIQFGKPIASFQGVQFQLTEAEVERAGLEELAKYALWSIEADRGEVLDDALALRVAALEAARVVFRVSHQVHGAIGFCDETTLSWLSRSSVPLRRLPLGLSDSLTALTRRLGDRTLPGLFSPDTARR